VALLDTIPPGPGRNAPFFARILIHFHNFGKLKGFKDFAAYLTDRLKRLFLRTIRHESARRLAQQIGLQPKSHISAARMAFALYNPQPYPGNVILFTVSQREWYVTWDPMEKWKDYILGKLEIRSIPGEHGTLINDPNTNELAQQLNECLERDAG
jgi:hypothetical protein